MIDYLLQNKKLSIRLAIGIVVIVLLTVIWTNVIRTPAYVVIVDGEEAFVVKNKSDVADTLLSIQKQQAKPNQPKLELSSKIDYQRTFASRGDIISGKELEKIIRDTVDFTMAASALIVNGNPIAYLESKAQAEQLLKKLKEECAVVDDGEKLISVTFAEKVTIAEKSVSSEQVMTFDEAYQLVTTGTDKPEKYIVQEGDNLWLIARRNDMYVDDIMRANQLKSEDLQIGDELILVKSQPYINVVAKVEGEKN